MWVYVESFKLHLILFLHFCEFQQKHLYVTNEELYQIYLLRCFSMYVHISIKYKLTEESI